MSKLLKECPSLLVLTIILDYDYDINESLENDNSNDIVVKEYQISNRKDKIYFTVGGAYISEIDSLICASIFRGFKKSTNQIKVNFNCRLLRLYDLL